MSKSRLKNERGLLSKEEAIVAKKKAKTGDPEELSFEQSLAELEHIVQQLEDGELTMDQALTCYEKGIGRLKRCYQLLDAAEQKIETLVKVDEDGNPITAPFSDSGSP